MKNKHTPDIYVYTSIIPGNYLYCYNTRYVRTTVLVLILIVIYRHQIHQVYLQQQEFEQQGTPSSACVRWCTLLTYGRRFRQLDRDPYFLGATPIRNPATLQPLYHNLQFVWSCCKPKSRDLFSRVFLV